MLCMPAIACDCRFHLLVHDDKDFDTLFRLLLENLIQTPFLIEIRRATKELRALDWRHLLVAQSFRSGDLVRCGFAFHQSLSHALRRVDDLY